jgi:hypothetical protein
VIGRPANTVPEASLIIADAVPDPPTPIVAFENVTTTDATLVCTIVTVAVALMPSQVAVITLVPAAIPVTTPLDNTVALEVLLDVNVQTRPVTMLLLASRVTTLTLVEPPTLRLEVPSVMDTDATGVVMIDSVALPIRPSLVALAVMLPRTSPVYTPVVEFTEA